MGLRACFPPARHCENNFEYSQSPRSICRQSEVLEVSLGGIEDRKRQIGRRSPPDDMYHVGDVLAVVLDYVFAGQQREAWTFYDSDL